MSQSPKNMSIPQKVYFNTLVFSILTILIAPKATHAQSRFELGASISTMQYEGEIGGRFPYIYNDLNNPTSKVRLGAGLNFGYHLTDYFTFRASLLIGSVQAAMI